MNSRTVNDDLEKTPVIMTRFLKYIKKEHIELVLRCLSAFVLIPLTLWLTYKGGDGFLLLLMFLYIGALHECSRISFQHSFHPLCALIATTSFVLLYTPLSLRIGMCILTLFFLMCYIFYQQKKDVKTTAHACLSVLYIFASFFSFYKLAQFENGHFLILWMYIVVWSTDSGAYAIGRYLKGPKLWRRISPNKTWSGFIGGVYTALIISGTATEIPLFSFLKNIDLSHYWLIAFLSCAGHIGDLLESAYKRYYGVKDSGSIIPGHGGILDRLDSLLLVSIFSYFLVYLGYLKI